MREIVKILHVASTSLLAFGFLGVAVFVWVTNWGPTDGGANIGLAAIVFVCLVAGGLGIVVAAVALVLASAASMRGRQSAPQSR